jgi:uncharacterized protein YjcR
MRQNRETTSEGKSFENNGRENFAAPVLRIKNKGGAPRGNRNALKHGRFAAETVALRRRCRALTRRCNDAIRSVNRQLREARAQSGEVCSGSPEKLRDNRRIQSMI